MPGNGQRSALVLVEFQNQWTRPGLYHSLIRRELSRGDVIGRAANLAQRARAAGVPVVHAPLELDPAAPRGLLGRLTRFRVFRKGTDAARIDDRLLGAGDLVAHGRYSFDAFVGSDLETLLQGAGASTVYLAGFATDQCVARSVRTALLLGLDAYLVADCSATFAGWLQRRAEASLGDRAVRAEVIPWAARFPVRDRAVVS